MNNKIINPIGSHCNTPAPVTATFSGREKGWVKTPNKLLDDGGLSLDEIGLLVTICSYPKDWKFKAGWLAKKTASTEAAIRKILQNLRKKGYALLCKIYQQGKIAEWRLLWSMERQAGWDENPRSVNLPPGIDIESVTNTDLLAMLDSGKAESKNLDFEFENLESSASPTDSNSVLLPESAAEIQSPAKPEPQIQVAQSEAENPDSTSLFSRFAISTSRKPRSFINKLRIRKTVFLRKKKNISPISQAQSVEAVDSFEDGKCRGSTSEEDVQNPRSNIRSLEDFKKKKPAKNRRTVKTKRKSCAAACDFSSVAEISIPVSMADTEGQSVLPLAIEAESDSSPPVEEKPKRGRKKSGSKPRLAVAGLSKAEVSKLKAEAVYPILKDPERFDRCWNQYRLGADRIGRGLQIGNKKNAAYWWHFEIELKGLEGDFEAGVDEYFNSPKPPLFAYHMENFITGTKGDEPAWIKAFQLRKHREEAQEARNKRLAEQAERDRKVLEQIRNESKERERQLTEARQAKVLEIQQEAAPEKTEPVTPTPNAPRGLEGLRLKLQALESKLKSTSIGASERIKTMQEATKIRKLIAQINSCRSQSKL